MRAIDADAMIKRLKAWDTNDVTDKALYNFALNRVLEAPTIEPEQQWIPCSERLPEENVPVLLGVRFKDGFKFFVSARIDYNYWSGLGREIKGELRWMPLPEPYREDGGE